MPYKTGDITGVKLIMGNESGVYYNDHFNFKFFKINAYYISSDCDLTSYPSSLNFGKVHDGMILDVTMEPSYCVKDDYSICESDPISPQLFKIQDVFISGKRYNKALIMWTLDTNKPYVELNFYGKEHETGLILRTA